ncbi:PadR family transcriptional regulator [Pseudonocardia sp. TRM90224]|uniref:PadR family transcriptional regulator n=1 Tax=Pseudonocardia sp. TRM90224 TaxID=2812678 RepID=UPI001E349DAB|nr:PadR family transcriptional regulator [Pseudonocardia sp. TRM90224]
MPLRRADRDLPGLTVLALLLTGPRHTYEMHRLMIDTRKDFVTGLPRSMYHSVERLLRDGLIVVDGTVRDGTRPERIVYAVTDEGRAEVAERIRRLLRTPDPDATLLVAALSFIGCLRPDDAAAALRARHDTLAARCVELREAIEGIPIPRVLMLEAEFEFNRAASERDWVADLVAELESGGLGWPADPRELAEEAAQAISTEK